jgi:hypothetical protein
MIAGGTVYDTGTKLTWQQNADTATYTQAQAINHCVGLGGTWRAPMASELLSITDRMKSAAPFIDLTAFPGTGSELFWTSTALSTGFGWVVDFSEGGSRTNDSTFAHRVRCVH